MPWHRLADHPDLVERLYEPMRVTDAYGEVIETIDKPYLCCDFCNVKVHDLKDDLEEGWVRVREMRAPEEVERGYLTHVACHNCLPDEERP